MKFIQKILTPQNLLYLTAVVLFLGGVALLAGFHSTIYTIYAMLFFADSLAFVLSAYFLKKHRFVYWGALTLTFLNCIALIFDQIGYADLAFSLLNLLIFVRLLISRKELIQS